MDKGWGMEVVPYMMEPVASPGSPYPASLREPVGPPPKASVVRSVRGQDRLRAALCGCAARAEEFEGLKPGPCTSRCPAPLV